MPQSTEPLWNQGRLHWQHDETGGWQTADKARYLPSVVLPIPGDLMTPGKPIEVHAPDNQWILSVDPSIARWLGSRLLEAAAITEMQYQGAM